MTTARQDGITKGTKFASDLEQSDTSGSGIEPTKLVTLRFLDDIRALPCEGQAAALNAAEDTSMSKLGTRFIVDYRNDGRVDAVNLSYRKTVAMPGGGTAIERDVLPIYNPLPASVCKFENKR